MAENILLTHSRETSDKDDARKKFPLHVLLLQVLATKPGHVKVRILDFENQSKIPKINGLATAAICS